MSDIDLGRKNMFFDNVKRVTGNDRLNVNDVGSAVLPVSNIIAATNTKPSKMNTDEWSEHSIARRMIHLRMVTTPSFGNNRKPYLNEEYVHFLLKCCCIRREYHSLIIRPTILILTCFPSKYEIIKRLLEIQI